MAITVEAVAHAVSRAHARMATLEQDLNVADSRLGDGDTGGMLARVIGKLSEQDLAAAQDVGAAFSQLARAAMSATGSSLGTLLATALLAMSREARGKNEIGWSDLSGLLVSARDAMTARGGASLGDKTVVDALDAVAAAIEGLADKEAVSDAAGRAAAQVLDQFRDRPSRIGRARMFAEKSVGMDDPGMLAFVRLLEAIRAA